jgi:hypothetical protein
MESLDVKLPRTEDLEKLLTMLIAEREKINEDEVTLGYMRARREKDIYPNRTYKRESEQGGWVGHGLISLSNHGFDRIEEINDELLVRI